DGQCVVRRAEFGEEGDRPLEMLYGARVLSLRRRYATESELDRRLAGRVRQCREQPGTLIEIARIEERFRQPHAGREAIRRDLQRQLQPRDGGSCLRETLQYDCVEIGPVEGPRRQRSGAGVEVVGGT